METFQELADEAFRDLLHKYGRPTDLKAALRESARSSAGPGPASRKRHPRALVGEVCPCLKHRGTKKSCEETGMTSFGIRTPTDLLNKLIEEQRDFEKSNWLSARHATKPR